MIDYKKFEVESRGSLYDCGNRLRRRNMIALLPDLYDKSVVELGFGIGDFWIELKRRKKATYKKYTGLDISRPNLKKARQIADDLKLHDDRTSLIQGDIFKLPLDGESIDIVICAEVLEHLDDRAAMREMNRVLKKGGRALITVPYLGEPVAGWGHLRHYDLEGLERLFKSSGFCLQKKRIFGRFHEISWVKIKRVLFRIWGIWKKISNTDRDYYESGFHRYLIMPLFDRFLVLDDIFRSPRSILDSKGYVVALIEKTDGYRKKDG